MLLAAMFMNHEVRPELEVQTLDGYSQPQEADTFNLYAVLHVSLLDRNAERPLFAGDLFPLGVGTASSRSSDAVVHARPCPGLRSTPLNDRCRRTLFSSTSSANVRFQGRIQPIDATVWLNISAGVWNPRVFLGLSFNCLATALSLVCE